MTHDPAVTMLQCAAARAHELLRQRPGSIEELACALVAHDYQVVSAGMLRTNGLTLTDDWFEQLRYHAHQQCPGALLDRVSALGDEWIVVADSRGDLAFLRHVVSLRSE